MKIVLRQLNVAGIYDTVPGPNDPLPARMSRMHPEASEALLMFESQTGGAVYSDMWRSAQGSLNAVANKSGVQPPAYSGHNFGGSFDVDVDGTLKRRRYTYEQLLRVLGEYGFYCHRRDGKRGREDWHFNFLGHKAKEILARAERGKRKTWSHAAESMIQNWYGEDLKPDGKGVQESLKRLGLYDGKIDGLLGMKSSAGIKKFCSVWKLKSGDGTIFRRVLSFVAAEIILFEDPLCLPVGMMKPPN